MIVDPESELGKSLGITSNSYSKRYIVLNVIALLIRLYVRIVAENAILFYIDVAYDNRRIKCADSAGREWRYLCHE